MVLLKLAVMISTVHTMGLLVLFVVAVAVAVAAVVIGKHHMNHSIIHNIVIFLPTFGTLCNIAMILSR